MYVAWGVGMGGENAKDWAMTRIFLGEPNDIPAGSRAPWSLTFSTHQNRLQGLWKCRLLGPTPEFLIK